MSKIMFLMSFMILLFTEGTIVCAQSERRIYTKSEQESAARRQADKKLEALRDSLAHIDAVKALENLDFVLEADQLTFKRGRTAFVNSNTNFISLSDDEAVVQVAPFNGGGPNGVGGITVTGRATNIVMKTTRKGDIYFSMNVSGTGISAYVNISLPKGTSKASVTVTPNFHSNRVTLSGELMPSSRSSVFKGTSL